MEENGRNGSSRSQSIYVGISALLATAALLTFIMRDLLWLIGEIGSRAGAYSASLSVLALTVILMFSPGIVLVIVGEIEEVVHKWTSSGEESIIYARRFAAQYGYIPDRVFSSQAFITAAVLSAVFLAQTQLLEWGKNELVRNLFALNDGWPSRPWTLFTTGVAHAGPIHFFGSLLGLVVVGPLIQGRLSRGWWMGTFLTATAAASLAHLHVSSQADAILGAWPGLWALFMVFLLGVMPEWQITEKDGESNLWTGIGLGMAAAVLFLLFRFTQTESLGSDYWAHLSGASVGVGIGVIRLWVDRS